MYSMTPVKNNPTYHTSHPHHTPTLYTHPPHIPVYIPHTHRHHHTHTLHSITPTPHTYPHSTYHTSHTPYPLTHPTYAHTSTHLHPLHTPTHIHIHTPPPHTSTHPHTYTPSTPTHIMHPLAQQNCGWSRLTTTKHSKLTFSDQDFKVSGNTIDPLNCNIHLSISFPKCVGTLAEPDNDHCMRKYNTTYHPSHHHCSGVTVPPTVTARG